MRSGEIGDGRAVRKRDDFEPENDRGDVEEFLANRGARLDLEGAAGTGRVDDMTRYIYRDGHYEMAPSRSV